MKKRYSLVAICVLSTLQLFAQRGTTFEQQYEPVRNELRNWDPVKGEWLSNSFISMSNQEAVPKRSFEENYTPSQMLDLVPTSTLQRLRNIANSHANDSVTGQQWNDVSMYLDRPNCKVSSGRSYGDPHLVSMDGARYSFQTVGEFTLAKSGNGAVDIQTRQKSQSDDFSLNTAIAMNVNGDRVALYAEDYPDSDRSTPVRVNGRPVTITNEPFALNNGGVIRKSRGLYVVDWPTGESTTIEMRDRAVMSFMNVTVNVYPCLNGGYSGLMGNANGFANDDYNTSRGVAPVRMAGSGPNSGNAEFIEKQRLAYLAQEFAEDHRITQATSLFDYAPGTSTFTFTDRTFPRVHRSINDLPQSQRDLARKHCTSNGVSGADMEGCIYDNAYLGIQPAKRHMVDPPAEGIRVPHGVLGGDTGEPGDVNPNPVKDPVKSKGTTIYDTADPIKPKDEPDFKVKEPTRNSGSDRPSSGNIRIDTPRSNGGGITRPSTPTPRPSTPRPSTPKPRMSTPKPGGGMIKGR